MINTVYINLYGGPGCGKSTVAAGVFTELKLLNMNVELVTEFAKDLTWEDNKAMLGMQNYVVAEQYRRLSRLNGKVDFVITDSPLMLNLYYADRLDVEHNMHVRTLHKSLGQHIDVRIDRVKPFQQIGRNETKEHCILIDEWFKEQLEFDYVVSGDKCGITALTERIVNIHNKTLNIF